MKDAYVLCNQCQTVFTADIDEEDDVESLHCPECDRSNLEVAFECEECGNFKPIYGMDKDMSGEVCYECSMRLRDIASSKAFEEWENNAFHRLRDDRLTGHAEEENNER